MISIWERDTFFAPQDIIIIGSGFTGLWSALQLKRKQPALRITILEQGLIPTGASTRNAGFACFGSLSELVHDGHVMGKDNMLQLVELRFKGLERIRKFFKPSVIDYELVGGYELYPHGTDEGELKANMAYINTLLQDITGSKNSFRQSDDELTGLGFGNTAHLVKNKFEGALHSGKLLKALLREVQSMGVQVLNNISVTHYSYNNSLISLETAPGFSFSCGQLLLCTNAFTRNLLPELDIVPARGQVILTSPIPGLPVKGTFHADEGYYYFRNLGDRLLLGGARNKAFDEEQTHAFDTTPMIQQELERYLAEVVLPGYSGQYQVEHRWSGIMAMGSEKMPIIGEVAPGVFAAVRMSGMGVALAPVAAQQVAKMLLS